MTVRTILVLGATGTQGGAVADRLVEDDTFEVHALTRDPESAAAGELADRGATVVEGDLGDKETLVPAIEDVDGVFAVTNFWEHGYDVEIEHGINVAEAAADVGIDHFVFSSVGGADRETGISHFDSKYEIERRISELELPATILRPVFFMQNFEGMREEILDGTLAMALEPRVPLQMLDVTDLGAIVAHAFENQKSYIGEAFELSSDELTLQAMGARFAAITGNEIEVQHVPVDALRDEMGDEYGDMFEWFNDYGYEADLAELRANHPVEFTRLETYLETNGWTEKQ